MISEVSIYVEGGGDSTNGKDALRRGLNAMLTRQKERARELRLGWQLVLCGGRQNTFDKFRNATNKSRTGEVVALLVDAEGPVADRTPTGRKAHLHARDHWDLTFADPDRLHLMVQTMETWIVADRDEIERYYGRGFANKLSKRQDLDAEPKDAIAAALTEATRHCGKGTYHKIKHASELLAKVRPDVVAQRCQSFRDFVAWLDATLGSAVHHRP